MYKKFLNCFHVANVSDTISNNILFECDRTVLTNLVTPIVTANRTHPLTYQSNCELYQVEEHYYTHFNKLKFNSKSIKTNFLKSSLKSLQ